MPPLTLLLWDAPNIDMTLSGLLNRRPSTAERPRFDALGRWLVDRAREDSTESEIEACVFVNVPVGDHAPLLGWVKVLLGIGFRVFAKPRNHDSDIDEDMLAHLDTRRDDLAQIFIASNDAEAFRHPLEEAAARGVRACVLGFTEYSGGYAGSDGVEFIDLEEIADLFQSPLPERVRLDALPQTGRWFEPSGSLLALMEAAGERP